MKIRIAFFSLIFLFLSNIRAMDQIDEAISKTNVEWVKKILTQANIKENQKKAILKTANNMLKERIHNSQSLFRSPRDLLRLFFGLGVNGSGCTIILLSLFSEIGLLAFDGGCNGKRADLVHQYILIAFGIGSATWLFGLYNFIKGWKMSSAHEKLRKARQIQQLIENIEPQKNEEEE